LKNYIGRAQESREREGKKEKKINGCKVNTRFCFLHASLLHERDIEMNPMTSLNDIFWFSKSATHII
jgi:hypothetical protein